MSYGLVGVCALEGFCSNGEKKKRFVQAFHVQSQKWAKKVIRMATKEELPNFCVRGNG